MRGVNKHSTFRRDFSESVDQSRIVWLLWLFLAIFERKMWSLVDKPLRCWTSPAPTPLRGRLSRCRFGSPTPSPCLVYFVGRTIPILLCTSLSLKRQALPFSQRNLKPYRRCCRRWRRKWNQGHWAGGSGDFVEGTFAVSQKRTILFMFTYTVYIMFLTLFDGFLRWSDRYDRQSEVTTSKVLSILRSLRTSV